MVKQTIDAWLKAALGYCCRCADETRYVASDKRAKWVNAINNAIYWLKEAQEALREL